MRLLLDTHVVLWALADSPKLRPAVRAVIEDAEAIHVSAASIWEIAVKRAIGKLTAPDDIAEVLAGTGVLPLSITWQHADAAGALPPHHADPFDRLLIAQARAENLCLVSEDRAFRRYEVELI